MLNRVCVKRKKIAIISLHNHVFAIFFFICHNFSTNFIWQNHPFISILHSFVFIAIQNLVVDYSFFKYEIKKVLHSKKVYILCKNIIFSKMIVYWVNIASSTTHLIKKNEILLISNNLCKDLGFCIYHIINVNNRQNYNKKRLKSRFKKVSLKRCNISFLKCYKLKEKIL